MRDPEFGRYKAFLVVGIAYFLVAVIAPLILLKVSGSNLKFTAVGFKWSLIAGTVGAIGVLWGVLLAFGAKGAACCRDVYHICWRPYCECLGRTLDASS